MATDLSLINAALTRTGSNPLTALTSGSATAAVASANYEKIIGEALASYPWKFATKIAALTLLDEDDHGAPPEPWSYAYQKPTDLLDLRTIMVGGRSIPYALHGNTILCDQDNSSDLIAHYLWRAPESAMPAWFQEAVIVRLEALFLRAIGERYGEAADRDQAAFVMLNRAKLRDSQGQTARAVVNSPTLRARGGGYGYSASAGSVLWRR